MYRKSNPPEDRSDPSETDSAPLAGASSVLPEDILRQARLLDEDDVEPSYLIGSVHGVLAGGIGAVSLLLAVATITMRSPWAMLGTAIAGLALAALWAEIRRLCRRERLWAESGIRMR